MLTSKQRAAIRSVASTTTATTIIGVTGIDDNLIRQVKMDLSNKEVVKIKVLPNCGNVVADCATMVAQKTKSEVAQIIGNNFVLYKLNNKKGVKHVL